MKETVKLNTRQWALYNYLKANSNKYKFNKEILFDLREFYPEKPETQEFNNSTGRRVLTSDLTALKNSDVIQTVIISSTKKGIKIATEEEYRNYLENRKLSLLKSLKTTYKQMEKAKLNNQKRIVLKYEKDIIESLLKEEVG